jgi:vitamin B12 transporter
VICSKTILVGCSFLLAPFLAIGKKEQSPDELTPMVLVETRSPRPLSETSPWVTVLSGEDLERRQIHSVADALRTVPGMVVVRSGQAGSLASLFSRGANSDHVMFLLDGRQLNGGFSGYYNLGQLSLTGLSRLEVLRGPSSTLYGAEGIGGAVMLRSGDAPRTGFSSGIGLSGGSFGTMSTRLMNGFRDSDWSGSFGTSATTTDNDVPNATSSNLSGSFRLARRINDQWSLDLVGLGYRSELGLPGNAKDLSYPSLNNYQDTEQFLFSPGFIGSGDGWSSRGFYSRSVDELESLTAYLNHFRVETDQLEAQVKREIGDAWSLTFGGGYMSQHFRKMDLGAGTTMVDDGWENLALFSLLGYAPVDRFEITLGARAEDYSDFGSPMTWTLSARHNFTEAITLFGRLATGYAPPTAGDLYGGSQTYAVDPEESRSWEVGVTLGEDEGQQAFLVFFQTDFDNLIEWSDLDGDTIWTPYNVGEAESWGAELGVDWSFSEEWHLRSGYTYLEARDESDGSRLLRRPRHTGTLGLERMKRNLLYGMELRFSADIMDFEAILGEASGEDFVVGRIYTKISLSEKLEFSAHVENLFDEEYEEVNGYPALGIGAFGGLRYSF